MPQEWYEVYFKSPPPNALLKCRLVNKCHPNHLLAQTLHPSHTISHAMLTRATLPPPLLLASHASSLPTTWQPHRYCLCDVHGVFICLFFAVPTRLQFESPTSSSSTSTSSSFVDAWLLFVLPHGYLSSLTTRNKLPIVIARKRKIFEEFDQHSACF